MSPTAELDLTLKCQVEDKCVKVFAVFSVVVSAAVTRDIVKIHEFLVLPPVFRTLYFVFAIEYLDLVLSSVLALCCEIVNVWGFSSMIITKC